MIFALFIGFIFIFIRLFFSIDIPMLSGISVNMFHIWLILFIFGVSTALINRLLNKGIDISMSRSIRTGKTRKGE